ncbi:MAG: ATP-dependent DNA ligase [Nanoarchaeota archaeon]|nr:ATP-dependent DNA ligase [Nanoarchaeota archaeon]
MKYSELVEIYEALSQTTKKLEKVDILARFLPKLKGDEEKVYLLRGRVFPDYDEREFGLSGQLSIKVISKSTGVNVEKVVSRFRKLGDLGDVAAELIDKKRQSTLFSKNLSVDKVFGNLRKLVEIEGKGSVDKKLNLVLELLTSASGREGRYIIRTILNDLRVGVADALLRDSIAKAFFEGDKDMNEKVEEAYDKLNDFALILEIARKGKKAFDKVEVVPGRPIKVMLPVKVTELSEAFRICGRPLAVEHKYDGFRVLINKDEEGKISLFTRRLDNVTKQFPDVVEIVKKCVKAKSFVLDSEIVGYDPKKQRYKPFEAISQRIRRKHDIESMVKKLPVGINIFDIIYLNGKSTINFPFEKRRKALEKIVKPEKWKIRLSKQFISDDEKAINKFYKDALKVGEEGIMLKKLDAPYRPGRRVGYMVKMKPEAADLDLVIVGAEYGKGKRSGGLTSYVLACRSNDGKKFFEVGKASSGLKEKETEEGTSYAEMDKLLQPLIKSEKGNVVSVRPKVVVSVTYQNVQPSPRYDSGYALRFPRITHYRPERGTHDIATVKDIKKEFQRMQKMRKSGLG